MKMQENFDPKQQNESLIAQEVLFGSALNLTKGELRNLAYSINDTGQKVTQEMLNKNPSAWEAKIALVLPVFSSTMGKMKDGSFLPVWNYTCFLEILLGVAKEKLENLQNTIDAPLEPLELAILKAYLKNEASKNLC